MGEPLGLSVWSGGAGWWNWERAFVHWAERNGYALDVAISTDLETVPSVLDGYRLFVCAGHRRVLVMGHARRARHAYRRRGNAAILSGNTCFWQVRFEPRRRHDDVLQVRGGRRTRYAGTPDERFLTGPWSHRLVGHPETSTIGLTFTRGGYSRYGLGVPRASGAYTVHRPEHWLFGARTCSRRRARLADTIVAYEVDGCAMTLGADGRPVPTHTDGTPPTLRVLATAPARLWAQQDQPSRYAHEPGELEHTALALWGDTWRDHVDEIAYNHAVLGVWTTPGGGTIVNAA